MSQCSKNKANFCPTELYKLFFLPNQGIIYYQFSFHYKGLQVKQESLRAKEKIQSSIEL